MEDASAQHLFEQVASVPEKCKSRSSVSATVELGAMAASRFYTKIAIIKV